MLFTSIIFMVFLAVVFCLWRLLPFAAGKVMLCLASLFFYGYFFPPYILLLLASGAINFLFPLAMNDRKNRNRILLITAVTANLVLLGYFKYFSFLTQTIENLLHWSWGQPNEPLWDILLPMGISFFTFQGMSYVVDVYRNSLPAQRNFIDFFAYLSFFPQLVAGPIVRATHFLPQLKPKSAPTLRDLAVAFFRISRGFFLKVVIADNLARYVDLHFNAATTSLSALQAWLGALMFAFQILCDFAGYSEIAIGVARLFGFRLRENFLNPYFAKGFRDFWRRWHISLSTWFRDYLYIPLGGNRVSAGRAHFNIAVVFLLSGLWHGANWTFVVWGAIHGTLLLIERWLDSKPKLVSLAKKPWGEILAVALTLVVVVAAWVPFRSPDMGHALNYWARMFDPSAGSYLFLAGPAVVVLIMALVVQCWTYYLEKKGFSRSTQALCVEGLAYLVLVLLLPGPSENFIYFQF